MRVLIITLIALIFSSAAGASVFLGLHGSSSRFESLTSQKTTVDHVFISFAQGAGVESVTRGMGPIPMLALVTGSYGAPETATPKSIALGQSDDFLISLNKAIDASPAKRFYLRPFPEMNGWWEANSAYNKNGSLRDSAHSTAFSRKAFARIAIITRGGSASAMSHSLAALGLPGISEDLPLTAPRLRLVWNPQGFGSPDLPGNSAQAYYPGDKYVDVVGDDLYDIKGHGATWAAAEALYKAHPNKSFAFPEWGLWGFDDAQFVRDMAHWVTTHKRTEMISYFSGKPGSVWDLSTKPASRKAYRLLISPLGKMP